MIIEKIDIENFMCYAGTNSMEFTEGINVIIGDNGYGKSKLYDAFYWVMYDQVFVPEKKEFQNTKSVKSKIISDKAKAAIKDGRVTASVGITFHNMEKDNVFILERKYSVIIKDGQVIESNDSEFTVMKKDLSYLNAKMVTDEDEKRRIVSNILPSHIKDYLWFQGEQVESIIDFNKQDSLTKAINVLSSIKRYDELIEIAASAAKSGNSEYDREVKRLSKDLDKSEQLENQKRQIESRIADLVQDETEAKENLSRAEEKAESLLSKFSDATKITEIKQRKKSIIEQLKSLNESLNEEQTSFHRKMFRNKWVLKGTAFLHEEFSSKYSAYENLKLKKAADLKAKNDLEAELQKKLQTRLPIDVPEPIYVQKMLEEERCLVCDREAKRDSEAWNKIKELIDRPKDNSKLKVSEISTLHNFSDDYKRLYHNGLALTHRISEIDTDITETLKKINDINGKIRQVNNEMKKVEDELQKLESDKSQSAEDAESIVAEYSIQNKYVKDFTEKVNKITQQIEYYRKNLNSINIQLKDLVTGEIPKWLIEKKQILNDFDEIATSTRDRVFSNLIAQLEKEANNHYTAMTSGNKSTRGQIKLRKLPNGNFMPEITDSNGNPLLGSNTSNLILVKLSAIMAIISAKSNDGIVSFYSLITDAPTSVFGEDYTIGFCKTVSKVYRQSIIMSKEFYKNQALRNELMANSEIKIGKVYMITPSIPENERADRNNLSTKIEQLN
ncbi:AAA family ATPase [Sediminibacterium salmoneum]|uniref:AAA family ATPase n=1 Tax=Sediminibacterium salmoneum TaxID=426421 RepID=UPI0004798616|nr:AAA family ATPase [Sediminibacterium salmoneum]